jgi:hypothetical protein
MNGSRQREMRATAEIGAGRPLQAVRPRPQRTAASDQRRHQTAKAIKPRVSVLAGRDGEDPYGTCVAFQSEGGRRSALQG